MGKHGWMLRSFLKDQRAWAIPFTALLNGLHWSKVKLPRSMSNTA
jgi:hypothetical protein